jgi:PAS domain S-box-containing protein
MKPTLSPKPESRLALVREMADLRVRLAEAEERLRAIGNGGVDGAIMHGPDGDQVFTLACADTSCRVPIEEMKVGVAEADKTQLEASHARPEKQISERLRVETDLRESEEQFRYLAEAAFEGIAVHDSGILLRGNAQYFQMFGFKPDELLGKTVLTLTVAPEARELVQQQIAANRLGTYETIGLRKDGSRFPMEIRVRATEWEGRKVRVAAIRDITERKAAEKALLTERNLLRAVIDNLPDMIFTKDTQGRFGLSNAAHLRLLGFTHESQAAGKSAFDFFDRSLARPTTRTICAWCRPANRS